MDFDELPAYVEKYEHDHPRWIWDDTNHWYPTLLARGVHVRHCADLRLRHNILRCSPLTDQTLLVSGDVERWDNFTSEQINEPVLFGVHDDDEPLDVVAEYRRQQATVEKSTQPKRLELLLAAESTAALLAAEMTFTGLPWRADIHDRILTETLGPRPAPTALPLVLDQLNRRIRAALNSPDLNIDSPAELLRALGNAGLVLDDTRSRTLERLAHPVIPYLLEYRKLQRLNTTNGWRWLETWVHDGRYRPAYVPGGVVSGRWAAVGGGALSLPAQLRPAVVADDGWTFVVADVAQLEPRVLAGMSGDSAMSDVARAADLYQNLVDAGVVETRDDAKLGMLGAMYGATQGESGQMVARLAERFPKAFGMVEAAARAGERGEVVHTFLGRGSPVPDEEWVNNENPGKARSWGRFTRNFIVQGTGAEWTLCWIATVRKMLWEVGPVGSVRERPHVVFFLHDEIIVHTPKEHVAEVVEAVDQAARKAGVLLFGNFPIDFPLDVSVVDVYAEAK